jgi:hypothetical protein
MPYGRDHDRFASIFESRSGEELTTAEIKRIVRATDPGLAPGSILPSDHDDVPCKNECDCRTAGQHLFERVGRVRYEVR